MRVEFYGLFDFLQGIHELLQPDVADRDVGFINVFPVYIKSLVEKENGFVVFLESKLLFSLLIEITLLLSLKVSLVALSEFLA